MSEAQCFMVNLGNHYSAGQCQVSRNLSALTAPHASREGICNEAALNSVPGDLGAGRQLLSFIGIFCLIKQRARVVVAVYPSAVEYEAALACRTACCSSQYALQSLNN